MHKKELTQVLLVFLVILLFLAIVFVKSLFQHISAEPFSIERMFSQENIQETLVLLGVISVIVIPYYFIKNDKEDE